LDQHVVAHEPEDGNDGLVDQREVGQLRKVAFHDKLVTFEDDSVLKGTVSLGLKGTVIPVDQVRFDEQAIQTYDKDKDNWKENDNDNHKDNDNDIDKGKRQTTNTNRKTISNDDLVSHSCEKKRDQEPHSVPEIFDVVEDIRYEEEEADEEQDKQDVPAVWNPAALHLDDHQEQRSSRAPLMYARRYGGLSRPQVPADPVRQNMFLDDDLSWSSLPGSLELCTRKAVWGKLDGDWCVCVRV
jgi:hypothetical protein